MVRRAERRKPAWLHGHLRPVADLGLTGRQILQDQGVSGWRDSIAALQDGLRNMAGRDTGRKRAEEQSDEEVLNRSSHGHPTVPEQTVTVYAPIIGGAMGHGRLLSGCAGARPDT